MKLAFVNERPDGDMDTRWAETEVIFILKLFRGVFHQHNDEGAPVLDWGHVFESLNKLDVGVSRESASSLWGRVVDARRELC